MINCTHAEAMGTVQWTLEAITESCLTDSMVYGIHLEKEQRELRTKLRKNKEYYTTNTTIR